ncbi:MAG: 2-C-methyl-D-erythritol 2,4-cyclodiphosphate synthase [Cyanobacterium sp. T60_A2020_053]|nr:2-C-methyl-D-erythritol 2,4-cyclodiphosphate synthase [Cyanobacterium sp. T60_A2020_053]
MIRIGNGYDLHRLVAGRKLILGGVEIKHSLGLLGHSDADVLTHAIMDALLGALSLGDIGHYFPPTDERWQGADSMFLLEKVYQLITERGWEIVNMDNVIVAQRPKLKPYLSAMINSLAHRLNIDPEQISIKATTNEGLDAVGREEAICVHSVVLITKTS